MKVQKEDIIFATIVGFFLAFGGYALAVTRYEVQPDKSVKIVEERAQVNIEQLLDRKRELTLLKQNLTAALNEQIADIDDQLAKIDIAITAARQ